MDRSVTALWGGLALYALGAGLLVYGMNGFHLPLVTYLAAGLTLFVGTALIGLSQEPRPL
ncbi:MAG: hypothetical protein ABEJ28_03360 [Salinigranum sp.]